MNWLQIIGAVAVTALVAFGLHSLDIWRIQDKHAKELSDQADQLNNLCDKEKQITVGVSHDYQIKLAAAIAERNRLRAQTAICVPVAVTASRHSPAPNNSGAVIPNGITSEALYDYAADYAKEHLQLMECQSFIQKTWALNGQ